jgi:DNA (cytosine-5)-methyltransferase 1
MRTGDLFAGWGGFSEGAEIAGATAIFGANHWKLACDVFRMNHPNADIFEQSLGEADFSQFPEIDVMLAGPSCKGFTRARGRERSWHNKLRNTMWAVINGLEVLKPSIVIVENVPEVQDWQLYSAFMYALELLGYATEVHVLDAADYGVPQNRVRWFCVGSLSSNPLDLKQELCNRMRTHISADEYIDWDYPHWTPINKVGRSTKILAQIDRARKDLKTDRFLIPYYGSGSGLTGRSIDRPIGTIVAHDIWAIVDEEHMRMLQPYEASLLMGFPEDFKRAGTRREQMRGLGNAVCPPVATALFESIGMA